MPREQLRKLLVAAGLLNVAREARDSIRAVKWLPSNSGFWLRGSSDGFAVPPLRLIRLATGTSSVSVLARIDPLLLARSEPVGKHDLRSRSRGGC